MGRRRNPEVKPTAKFRIEGEDATALAFRTALGNANKTATGIQKAFTAAFAGISLYAVGRAFTSTVGQAIELGDELNKAAIKAGIGGRAMSELAHVAKMADVELGSLSSSLRKMQVAISEAATGSKAQVQSLRDLGLQLKDIRDLKADKQFELLADRINDLKSEEDKARIVTELFGKSGADLLPMFEQGAEGIRMAREEAVRLGKSLSDDQVKALADAEDSVKRLGESWTAFKTLIVADIAPELSETFEALNAVMIGGAARTRHELQVAQESYARALAAGADGDSLARIDQKIREHKAALGIDNATGGRGGSPDALRPIIPTHRRLGDPDKQAKAAEKEAEEAQKRRIELFKDEQEAAHQAYQVELTMQELVAQSLEEGNEQIAFMGDLAIDEIGAINEVWREESDRMAEEAAQRAEEIKAIFDEGIFIAFEDGLDGMLDYWSDTLKKMAIQAAATELFNFGGGGVGKTFSSLLGFADGGRPPVGRASIVGERGPELFVPDGSGTIVPNHRLGGSQVVQHISIDARGSTVDSVKLLQAAMPSVIRQAVDSARMAVRDDLSRGRMR